MKVPRPIERRRIEHETTIGLSKCFRRTGRGAPDLDRPGSERFVPKGIGVGCPCRRSELRPAASKVIVKRLRPEVLAHPGCNREQDVSGVF